jgi:uncharacterized protein (DUF2141 family)
MVNTSGGDMTVDRLAVAVLLCAGLDVTGAGAQNAGEPISVAVPPSANADPEKMAPDSPVPRKDKGTGEGSAPAAEGMAPISVPLAVGAERGRQEDLNPTPEMPLDEEYMPLDLPPAEGDGGEVRPDAPDGEVPGVEPAVLGLGEQPAAPARFVHAEILGIPSEEGIIAASLCTRKNFTKSGCRTERVAARQDRVSVTFDNVAPGTYAVQVHHDVNNNGKMDFTFFGLPKEPYGFSRDAKPMLAPPKFDAASFEVNDSDVSLVINLQNT